MSCTAGNNIPRNARKRLLVSRQPASMALSVTLNDIERLDLLLLKLDDARFALPAVLRALSGAGGSSSLQSVEETVLEYRNRVSNATTRLDELQTSALASTGAPGLPSRLMALLDACYAREQRYCNGSWRQLRTMETSSSPLPSPESAPLSSVR